ncbi:MAG: UvrD-helicase domain-containing protein, partial [Actinomycetota bacterium]
GCSPRIKALSGSGTSKTFATMRRVHRLLAQGVSPERILVATLTRTAAEDLKRALERLGVEAADKVVARTLHAHCVSVLARSRCWRRLTLSRGFSQSSSAP